VTRTLIMGASDEFTARINVLPGTQVVVLKAQTLARPGFDLLRILDPQQLPDVVFFGDECDLDWAMTTAGALDEQYPSVLSVLVGEPPSGQIVEAMRVGFKDIVEVSAPDARLLDILRRAESRRLRVESVVLGTQAASVPPETTRTISIVSPKGGVGKTSIATNLAIGLSRHHPMEVVLVDLDLQFGDVASTLDITPTSTIEDALLPAAASDNLVLKTMLSVHDAGFYVLCGPESPAAADEVTGEQITRLLAQLSSQFRYIVVDTAGGLSEPTLAALEVSDDAVLVSTMDVSCVRGMRKEVELLSELGLLPESRLVALNFADRESGMKVKDVEAVIGLPVDIVLPRSPEVQLAANHGEPLMLTKKRRGGFVKSIDDLVKKIERKGGSRRAAHKRLEVA